MAPERHQGCPSTPREQRIRPEISRRFDNGVAVNRTCFNAFSYTKPLLLIVIQHAGYPQTRPGSSKSPQKDPANHTSVTPDTSYSTQYTTVLVRLIAYSLFGPQLAFPSPSAFCHPPPAIHSTPLANLEEPPAKHNIRRYHHHNYKPRLLDPVTPIHTHTPLPP
jgi:hypothetical protein